jgi:hypothetical protein
MRNAGDLAIDLAEAALEGANAVSGTPARVVGSASAGDDKGGHGESEFTELRFECCGAGRTDLPGYLAA